MNPLLIPQPDPTPLPAPVWLFHALLLVTFFVHVLFLNVTLGTSLIGAVHGLAHGGKAEPGRWLREALVAILPVSVAFTVTTGVAPLLFVQVVYAQLFYPATILIGWAWVSIPLLVMLAYASVYAVKLARISQPARGWLLLIALGFLAVAAIHVTANVLQLTPARWPEVAAGHGALGDPTLLPRLLHFVLGSLAVGGMALAFLPRRPGGPPEAGWLPRVGVRWALVATALQMVDGFWFIFALPVPVLKTLVAGRAPATPLVAIAMSLGFLTLMLLSRLDDPGRQPGLLHGAAASLLLTIFGMVMLRDAIRDLYLQAVLPAETLPVRTQLDLIALFVVVLVLGLATLAWILRRILHERAARAGKT